MKTIHVPNFSKEEFLEFVYIAGLHKRAALFAKALDLEHLLMTISEKYKYANLATNHFTADQNEDLKIALGLCETHELKFLRDIASELPEGSNILEVGTYVGGSSLALLQGAKYSKSKYTGIDVYAGFPTVKFSTNNNIRCMHWEHMEWQNTTAKYSELITTYHGCSIPLLKNLIKDQKKYDLIFVDTAHEIDSLAEFALISCLASDNCLFVLDDIIDHNPEMTAAWLMSLKYNFAFPKFYQSRYALARPKNTTMPLNFKAGFSDIYDQVSEIADFIGRKLEQGCRFAISEDESKNSGFSINVLESQTDD